MGLVCKPISSPPAGWATVWGDGADHEFVGVAILSSELYRRIHKIRSLPGAIDDGKRRGRRARSEDLVAGARIDLVGGVEVEVQLRPRS